MSTGPERVPFVPADADAVARFCVEDGGGPYDARLVRRLLLDLTSDPSGVIVLSVEGRTLMVATVIDRAHNDADAANLEVLGVAAPLAAASFARLVLQPAIAFARAGARRALHLTLSPAAQRQVAGAADEARQAGFTPLYESLTMRRDSAAPLPPTEGALTAGWRWAAGDEARAAAMHAALLAMFAGMPSFHLSPLPDFQRMIAGRSTRWRLLLDGERIVGLVQLVAHAAQGEVRTVARDPAYRGRGIGARLVNEALKLLQESGARDARLEVQADNEPALALYRRFGFDVEARTPVFELPLR